MSAPTLFHAAEAIADARAEATEYLEIYEATNTAITAAQRKHDARQAAMYSAILAGLDALEAQTGDDR